MDLKMSLYYRSPYWMQNVLISSERFLVKMRRQKRISQMVSTLLSVERASMDQIRERQLKLTQRLLAHAYENVPYYKELFDTVGIKPADIQTLEDLQRIPVLTKKDVRENYEKLISRDLARRDYVHSHTSGTTGSPLSFLMSADSENLYEAVVIRHRAWHGYHYDKWMASLGGKVVVSPHCSSPPFWRYSWPDRLAIFSAFHLKSELIPSYVRQMRQLGIRFLKGYPSNLAILATYLASNNEYLPMERVFTGSEPLYPQIRALLEDRFQTRVFDFYGDSERSVLACQCEMGNYHVCPENSVVEITDESGRQVGLGELGFVTGTNLYNYAMPLIRYQNGDVAAIAAGPCECGRSGVLMGRVETKREDIILTADGRAVSPSTLTHPFKPISPRAILQSQLIQQVKGELTVRIVPGPEFSDLTVQQLLDGFRQRFLDQLVVTVHTVSDIPRTKSGKYRWVISHVREPLNAITSFLSEEDDGAAR